MAEHATAEAGEHGPPKKRSLLKLTLLGLNVVLFLVGVGSLAWTKFGPKPEATAATEEHQHDTAQKSDTVHEPAAKRHAAPPKAKGGHGGEAAKHGKSAAAKPAGGHGGGHGGKGGETGNPLLVPLAPFIVNLSGDQGQRYLRLAVQVELREDLAEVGKAALEHQLPEVRNRLIFLLTSKTFADIGSTQGKYDLQSDITKHINETLDGPFIRKTFFTEFIVQ